MKAKTIIKVRKPKSSLTGKKLYGEFYILSKSGIGFCTEKDGNYTMDIPKSMSIIKTIYSGFVQQCYAKTHKKREQLLSENLFLYLSTGSVIGGVMYEKKKKIERFNEMKKELKKNIGYIKLSDKTIMTTRMDRLSYEKMRINGKLLSKVYGPEQSIFKDLTYFNGFKLIEKSIFDKLTANFENEFPTAKNEKISKKNYRLIIKKLCDLDSNDRLYISCERDEMLVSYFYSKLDDLGLSLSRNAKTKEYYKERINNLEVLESLMTT